MSCTNSAMPRVWRTLHLWMPVIILACCFATMVAPVTVHAQGQEVLGPPDDPYTPEYPIDLSASTVDETTTQKGAGIPQTITDVNITSIDPSNFPDICTFVEVLDEQGNPIPGLSLDSFCVRQDIYDIDSFSVHELKDQCPTSICLVLDVSGSMLFEGKIDSLKSAAHQFVNNMDVYDRVALVKFSSCYTIVQDFTSDKTLLHTMINTLGASGRTAALDGIYQGVQLTVPEVGSKAVIALSDGMENNSFYCDAGPDGLTFNGFGNDSTLICNLATGGGIPVFTIALGSTFDPHYLMGIAQGTGGTYYHAPTGADIAGIYNSIKFRICSRYLICYTSPDTILNGDCHDVIICRQDAAGACTVCDTGKYCEPYPPTITINLDGCQPWNQDVQLCATVVDSDTPPESLKVRLFYRNSVINPYTDVLMTHQGGTSWCATIPKSLLPCGGDPIQYYVTASDGISTVVEPSGAPVNPAQFEICPNSPPRCVKPNDTTISLCTPVEVCLPVGCVDPDGNLVAGYPQQTSGPGSLSNGNWCYTPSGDGSVTVGILCVDSCGAQSECSFTVDFQLNSPPVCHFRDTDTTIFLCEPLQVCFPYYGTDQNLDSCRVYVGGVDKIVPQGDVWCYTPKGDETVTFTMRCWDHCGEMCEKSFTAKFVINKDPMCNLPEDTTVFLCAPQTYCVPFEPTDVDGNFQGCETWTSLNPTKSSNSGYSICASITESGPVTFYAYCADQCGAHCFDSTIINFIVNEAPVCQYQYDTTITQCSPTEICLPVGCTDANGNRASGPTLIAGPGTISNGMWCYTPTETGTINFTYECKDSCGASCQTESVIDVQVNHAPECHADIVAPTPCPPYDYSFNFNSVDPDGDTLVCSNVNQNAVLGQGTWTYPNAQRGEHVVDTITCTDPCGETCIIPVDITFPDPEVPVCTLPNDTTILLCELGPVCLPVSATADARCIVADGVGSIDNGLWCYTPTGPGSYTVYVECITPCDTCRGSFTVDIKLNSRPVCQPGYDTTISLCNSEEVCLPVGCEDADHNLINGGPTLVSGPGAIDKGMWCYTPTQDETVNFTYVCKDECGDSCFTESVIDFKVNQGPTCDFLTPVGPLPCTPPLHVVAYESKDPDGDTLDCTHTNPDATLGDGTWEYEPTPGEHVVDTIRCTDDCGEFCELVIDITYPNPQPPICEIPGDTTITVCELGEICLPVTATGGATCYVADGPGEIVDGEWCYTPTKGGTYSVYVECATECDTCSGSFVVTVEVNHPPVVTCSLETSHWAALAIEGDMAPPDYLLRLDGFLDGNPDHEVTFAPGKIWFVETDSSADLYGTLRIVEFDNGPVAGGNYDQEWLINVHFDTTSGPNAGWRYYTLVPDAGPEMVNANDPTDVCDLFHYGPPFQVGNGANQKNDHFGASGWMNFVHDSAGTVYGDQGVHWAASDFLMDLIPCFSFCEAGTINLGFGVHDPDGDSLDIQSNIGVVNVDEGRVEFFPNGSGIYTWIISATDPCEETDADTCVFCVEINQPPVLTCPPDLTFDCPVPDAIRLQLPTVADENPQTVEFEHTIDTLPGNCPQALSLLVTWVATDDCGLADTCEQAINWIDRTPPRIFCDECDDPSFEKSALEPLTETKSADGLCSASTQQGAFTFVFDSVKYNNGAGTSTWFYHLTWNGTPPALSHLTFGLCGNLTANDILQTSPPYDEFGPDGSTGLYGIKWDYSDGSFPANQSVPFSFTINQLLLLDQAEFAAKAGNDKTVHSICGPSLDCDSRESCAHIVSCDTDLDSLPAPEFDDNCDPEPTIAIVNRQVIPGPCAQSYGLIVTWEATDACGNTSRCIRNYKIIDNKPPEITCPPDTIVSCDELGPDALLSTETPVSPYGEPTVVDNCDPEPFWQVVSRDLDDKDHCHIVIRLGYQATDHCQNTSEICYQTITIVDTTAPTITCPADTTLECDELERCNEIKTATLDKSSDCHSPFGEPSVDDNCDPEPFWCLVSRVWVKEDPCESILRLGFLASDHCGNRTDTCFQLVTFVDTTGPEILCPSDTTIECDELPDTEILVSDDFSSEKALIYPFGMPLVKDNCDPEPEWRIVAVDPVDGTRCERILRIAYLAKDHCGNFSDSCFQFVTIVDTTGPEITCPADTILSCDELIDPNKIEIVDLKGGEVGPCAFPFGEPTATDNCDPEPAYCPVSREIVSDSPCRFVIKIGYLAKDHCDNFSDTCFQLVTMVDTTSPTITCPPDTTLSCEEFAGSEDVKSTDFADDVACPFGKPTVSDNCDPRPQYAIVDRKIISDNPCEFIFQIGYGARDRCDNYSDTCWQTITVVDTTAPEIACPADTTVSCDELDRITNTHIQGFDHPAGPFGSPEIKDNCDPEPQWSLVDLHLESDENCEKIFAIGFQGRDRCGNETDTCYQYVTVVDTTAPSCQLPADTAYFLCTADTTICRPVWATDNCDEAVECTVTNGVGSIDVDKWCFSPDTSGLYTVAVTCKDDCGNECSGEFHVAIRINTPPTVEAPPDRSEFVCEKGDTICVGPFPEYDVDGNEDYNYVPFGWMNPPFVCFEADTSGVYEIICCTVDKCGAESCDTTLVTVTINTPPVCHPPNDTTIFLCDIERVCLPYSCSDVDGNLMIVDPFEKGELEIEKDTFWCYTPQGNETLKLTVLCVDSCGAECQSVFYVTFVINDEPTCTLPNDTTIFLCGPEEVALPYSTSDPNGNFKECNIVEGPGELINGFWTYTPEEPETVTVVVDCVDSCGAECRDAFTVGFEFNQPPQCEFDELAPPVCVPAILTVPIKSTDPEGGPVTCEVVEGVGEIVGNAWQWEPIPGVDTTVVIHCTDTCGAYCELSFDVVIPNPQPPVCVVPVENQEYFFCQPEEITIPIKSISNVPGGAVCSVIDGPGEIVDTLWHYTPKESESFDVTVECKDICGETCQNTFHVDVTINSEPKCECPGDQRFFQCDPTEVQVKVSATDVDDNFAYCEVVSGPGEIKDGYWVYTPNGSESSIVTIRCWDECEAYCECNFNVTFDIDQPPICQLPGDTLIEQCNPTRVFLPISAVWYEPFGGGDEPSGGTNNPNQKSITRYRNEGGNRKITYDRDPRSENLAAGGTIDPYCQIISGPGELVNGFWAYTPSGDEQVTVVIQCTDQCGKTCRGQFTVTFEVSDPPTCQYQSPSPSQCVPTVVAVPFTSVDPEGGPVDCELVSGPGELNNGVWQWSPLPGQTAHVTIQCTDTCGDYCELTFDYTAPNPQPPICVLPTQDQNIFVCGPQQVTVPISHTGGEGEVNCEVVSGPGTISNGQWVYNATSTTSFDVTVECTDGCGNSCQGSFHVNIQFNRRPVCNIPSNQSFSGCNNVSASVPVSASDPDNNLSGCEVVSGPGQIVGGNWVYTATTSGEYNITVRCTDQCGLYCEGTFHVSFDLNEPPVCQFDDAYVFSGCDNVKGMIPLSVYDPDGNFRRCQKVSGPGAIIDGHWEYTSSVGGTFNVVIECSDSCGATCQADFDVTFDLNSPPICGLRDTTIIICGPSLVKLPLHTIDVDENLAECTIMSGPGSIVGNEWWYQLLEDTPVDLVIRCTDECGMYCESSVHIIFHFGETTPCSVNQDQDIYLCGPGEFCLDVPPDCDVSFGQGKVDGVDLCFLATEEGRYWALIECTDACGNVCSDTAYYQVHFDPSLPNCVPSFIGGGKAGTTSGVTSAGTDPCACPTRGDIDGDNQINAVDLSLLARFICKEILTFRGTPECPLWERADINCDGAIDMGDVKALQAYMFDGVKLPCSDCTGK